MSFKKLIKKKDYMYGEKDDLYAVHRVLDKWNLPWYIENAIKYLHGAGKLMQRNVDPKPEVTKALGCLYLKWPELFLEE